MSDLSPQRAPYGSWLSPISAASLTAGGVDISEPHVDGDAVYWLEGRPSDGGRVVIVRRGADGSDRDVTAAPFNVRSRVHEYGGGAFDVAAATLVFCHFDDRRVYRLDLGSDGETTAEPRPITPEGDLRYGDLRLVVRDGVATSLLAVCEDHSTPGSEPANRLVRLELDGANDDGGAVLVSGPDFVSSPAQSPDGSRLAWIQWNHPNMPWDDTELRVADLDDSGVPGPSRQVAGGPGESVMDPQWAPDGRLLLVSDRSGFWNLYAADVSKPDTAVEPLWPLDRDFGGPAWALGTRRSAVSPTGAIVTSWIDEGYARMGCIELSTGERRELPVALASVGSTLVLDGDDVVLVASFTDAPGALVRVGLRDGEIVTLRLSSSMDLTADDVSVAESVTWSNGSGEDVYGFYFAPRNSGYAAPDGELPPLVVMSHGGPTAMTTPGLQPALQYWTTRGFAILHVNYGGSSGFGRAYRERLRGEWGVVDVEDCCSGATAMVERGLADPARLAIKGGSAGGYTTLAALAFRDVFTAGSSWFGIGDLETLMKDTHKFESRYGDGLLGPYPKMRDLYIDRSPINHVDKISCPMILLQGADDPVVPRNQAEDMAAAVRAKGLPVALIVFEGEGHGFRRSENQIRSFEAESYFFSKVFGFTLADQVEPIEIANLR